MAPADPRLRAVGHGTRPGGTAMAARGPDACGRDRARPQRRRAQHRGACHDAAPKDSPPELGEVDLGGVSGRAIRRTYAPVDVHGMRLDGVHDSIDHQAAVPHYTLPQEAP
jgi:hypothetical protein